MVGRRVVVVGMSRVLVGRSVVASGRVGPSTMLIVVALGSVESVMPASVCRSPVPLTLCCIDVKRSKKK